ncbi:MAG: MarR family transcriptional regulator [Gammaproteobacteria bacterium]|nr:MAG: MarR family transcriptional regulator [Gammaproteobacteria bacterium]
MAKQPIDFLFSPYRRQVLAVLLLRPDERFHVRELERLTGVSAGSLHRELKAMAQAGLLIRAQQGNQVLYQADRSCSIFEELASIFRKTVGLAALLGDALAAIADRIEVAFVFGSVAAGKQHAGSDLDICVLGDVELLEVVKALGAVQENLHREINPVVMSATRFVEQLAHHERFAERIYDEPKIFMIGGEDEFGKLIKDQAT